MKHLIIILISVLLFACGSKTSINQSNADTLISDTIGTSISLKGESSINDLNTPDSVISNNIMNDVIIPDSVLINGILRFQSSPERLYKLMNNSPFEIKKEWEVSATYDSENDTLEYITFTKENITFVSVNGRVEFLKMGFDNNENSFTTAKMTINSKTSFDKLCSYYPNSCKNSSYNSKTKKRTVRFYPAYNFFESTEFWAIIFIEDKINEISFVILD